MDSVRCSTWAAASAVAGATNARGVARWNGEEWQAVGQVTGGIVRDMVVHDDGSGPKLWITGFFTAIDGTPAAGIAAFDGESWTIPPGLAGGGYALTSFGGVLIVGGNFNQAGSTPVSNVARWNGSSWSGFGSRAGQPRAGPHGRVLGRESRPTVRGDWQRPPV